MQTLEAAIHYADLADDTADYLRRSLAAILRTGVQRVAISEQASGVLLRAHFSNASVVDRYAAAMVEQLEVDVVLEASELHVKTTRQVTPDGPWTTVIRSRNGRMFAYVVHSVAAEVIVTAMPLDAFVAN